MPILWDRKAKRIVNNESSESIGMFNSEFNRIIGNATDYDRASLRTEIHRLNERAAERTVRT